MRYVVIIRMKEDTLSLLTFIIYSRYFSKTFFVDEFLAFTKAADTRETQIKPHGKVYIPPPFFAQ